MKNPENNLGPRKETKVDIPLEEIQVQLLAKRARGEALNPEEQKIVDDFEAQEEAKRYRRTEH